MSEFKHRVWVHRDQASDTKWAECETCGWKSSTVPVWFGSPPYNMELEACVHVGNDPSLITPFWTEIMTDDKIAEHFGKNPKEFAEALKVAGLMVILPGQVTTREFRTDRSRYFPTVTDGVVTGGSFG